jgi:plasmid stabilization system protein ParE
MKKISIEIDAETAELLQARATARGIGLSELLADLAGGDYPWPAEMEAQRIAGEGPWAPDVLADDARRLAEYRRTVEAVPWDEVRVWMQSWGTANELPMPRPRKLWSWQFQARHWPTWNGCRRFANKDVVAARRAVAEIVGAIDALTVFPDRGSPAHLAGLRDLIVPFGRSNYIVRYMHDRAISEIIIIRVSHGREARDWRRGERHRRQQHHRISRHSYGLCSHPLLHLAPCAVVGAPHSASRWQIPPRPGTLPWTPPSPSAGLRHRYHRIFERASERRIIAGMSSQSTPAVEMMR